VKSLVTGLDVPAFEHARAHVDAIIHSHSHKLKETVDEEPAWGVMDAIDFEPFVTMSPDHRAALLGDLARLLITYYYHNTWKVCLMHKIYGDECHNNPPEVFDEHGVSGSMNDFDCFPFLDSKVNQVTQFLETNGKFVKKPPFIITSTGK
jgi:hypothetical protein